MKSIFVFSLSFLCFVHAFAQHKKKQPPVLTTISNKELVQSVYPKAERVNKVNEFWYRISDAQKNILGFATSSSEYCKDIIGYNNTTPVMIITDKSGIIQRVALLSHWETPGYIRRLESKGFFNLWNGKRLKDAAQVQIDGYAGATISARAVEKNVSFLLTKAAPKIPRK